MKGKEIVGSFFGIFVIIIVVCLYIYINKRTIVEKSGVIEYKLDATYQNSTELFIFRLINNDEIFDVKVDADTYLEYNKGDTYIHEMIYHRYNIALVFAIISMLICVIILIIYFTD